MKIISRKILLLPSVISLLFCAWPAYPADVLIIGDTGLQPISNLVKVIDEVIPNSIAVRAPNDIKDDPANTVSRENAKVVVALGKDAVDIADKLPESVPVIFGLVIKPPDTKRRNITGVYLATPLKEYISFLNRYFPEIKKIGIVCHPESLKYSEFCVDESKNVEIKTAENSYEFVMRIKEFKGRVDAVLLLPEKQLISEKAVENVYLFTFTMKIPVIGISEKYVKTGSFFSLVFDEHAMGRQIGRLALKALSEGNVAGTSPIFPDRFTLYLNRKTAETMNIKIPDELLKTAKRIYP